MLLHFVRDEGIERIIVWNGIGNIEGLVEKKKA